MLEEKSVVDSVELTHLLRHLGRIGVSYLPRSNPADVERLRAQWAVEPADASATELTGGAKVTPPGRLPPGDASRPSEPPPVRSPTKSLPPAAPVQSPAKSSSPPPLIEVDGGGWLQPVLEDSARSRTLAALAEQVAGCARCPQLACARHTTVFGEGNPRPRVCFFGEAPGADEDRLGRPFVGAAGQLLDRIIEACSFQRSDVYILNTIKCRPPGNRNPADTELANCREYFESQFEILQPEYIVCLGLVAAKALLPDAASIGRLRGRFHAYRGARLVVTYHPAYLLRNPSAKAATWEDMKMMLRAMGISPKSR